MAISRRRRAFTLLEMILVLAVIAMIMAAAVPSIEAMLADAKLQEAADLIRSRFAEARSHAIEEGRPYRFAVMPNQSDYRVAPDLPEYWGDGQTTGDSTTTAAPALVVETKLPNGILFQLGDGTAGRGGDSGPWTHLVSFLPDGSCDNDCSIVLEFEDSRPVQITVRSLTGSVTAQSISKGGSP